MASLPLPAWAVVGADVVIECDQYGGQSNYVPATISRVSASSVWAKRNGRDYETRFVMGGWQGKNVLVQHGMSGSWDRPQYLFDAADPKVIERQEANRLQDAYHKALLACRVFTDTRPSDTPVPVRARRAVVALRAYLDTYEAEQAKRGQAQDQ